MADNSGNSSFFDSLAANSPLGGMSSSSGISSALSQSLEEQAAKALTNLAKSREFSGNVQEISQAVKQQLESAIKELGNTINADVIGKLSDVAKAATAVSPLIATNKGELDTQTVEKIIRSAVQVQSIVGYENLSKILTKQVFPQVSAESPLRQYSAGAAANIITAAGASTAFTKRPMETAKQFIYGQLPSEYLLYGGPAITAIGSPLRREFSRTRGLAQSTEGLDLHEDVQHFFESETNVKTRKLNEYLSALNSQFSTITAELQEAVKANDTKKAADLKRTLAALGQEIVETKKTLTEAEDESKQKRRMAVGSLYAATSPIGRHAVGALRNPVPSLIRESLKVAMDTSQAVSSIIGGMEGDNVVEMAALFGIGGTAALAGSMLGKPSISTSPEIGEALSKSPIKPVWGGPGVIGTAVYPGVGETHPKVADAAKEVSDSFKKVAEKSQDLASNIKATSEGFNKFSGLMSAAGLGAMGIGALYAAVNAPAGGEIVQPAISMSAGALAGFLNFGLGAIDVGQNNLLNYWSGTTGLNVNQYLRLSGGARNVSSYLGQSVLGTDALRMGFGINDITRGYEVFQRGMPTGELSAQAMRGLLDENAKIARALGLRLEESIQFATEMRKTFGTGVTPEKMGGLISGLGADRFGNFETAFSKAVAQGFVQASRSLMMQGVTPESAVRGFGSLRNVFLGPHQPDYLRTLVETNPQAITGMVSTFGGMLRQGAAGSNPWSLGMGLRSGMTIEEMARGGPESVMKMLDELMQELPLGTMAPGGKLGRQGRDILSMFAAQQGLNPDLIIGYAESYARGDTERARRQFRAQVGRGAAWEAGLTTHGVQRSPLVEENMAVLQRTTARLARTAEEFQDAITTVNTALLGLTDAALHGMETLHAGIKAFGGLLGIDEENVQGTSAGVSKSKGLAQVPVITVVDDKGNPIKGQPSDADIRGENAARRFRESGGVFSTLNSRTLGAGNTQTIIKVDGTVQIEEHPLTGFVPESEK